MSEVGFDAISEDLYFRLNVVPTHLPTLRERVQHILLLVGNFLKRFTTGMGVEPMAIDDGTLELLMEHEWPGNVRELRNVIQRSVVLCPGDVILRGHVAPDLHTGPKRKPAAAAAD